MLAVSVKNISKNCLFLTFAAPSVKLIAALNIGSSPRCYNHACTVLACIFATAAATGFCLTLLSAFAILENCSCSALLAMCTGAMTRALTEVKPTNIRLRKNLVRETTMPKHLGTYPAHPPTHTHTHDKSSHKKLRVCKARSQHSFLKCMRDSRCMRDGSWFMADS